MRLHVLPLTNRRRTGEGVAPLCPTGACESRCFSSRTIRRRARSSRWLSALWSAPGASAASAGTQRPWYHLCNSPRHFARQHAAAQRRAPSEVARNPHDLAAPAHASAAPFLHVRAQGREKPSSWSSATVPSAAPSWTIVAPMPRASSPLCDRGGMRRRRQRGWPVERSRLVRAGFQRGLTGSPEALCRAPVQRTSAGSGTRESNGESWRPRGLDRQSFTQSLALLARPVEVNGERAGPVLRAPVWELAVVAENDPAAAMFTVCHNFYHDAANQHLLEEALPLSSMQTKRWGRGFGRSPRVESLQRLDSHEAPARGGRLVLPHEPSCDESFLLPVCALDRVGDSVNQERPKPGPSSKGLKGLLHFLFERLGQTCRSL